jgi:hypothetical protein
VAAHRRSAQCAACRPAALAALNRGGGGRPMARDEFTSARAGCPRPRVPRPAPHMRGIAMTRNATDTRRTRPPVAQRALPSIMLVFPRLGLRLGAASSSLGQAAHAIACCAAAPGASAALKWALRGCRKCALSGSSDGRQPPQTLEAELVLRSSPKHVLRAPCQGHLSHA